MIVIMRTNRNMRALKIDDGKVFGLPNTIWEHISRTHRAQFDTTRRDGMSIEMSDPPSILPEDCPLIDKVSVRTSGARLTASDGTIIDLSDAQFAVLFG